MKRLNIFVLLVLCGAGFGYYFSDSLGLTNKQAAKNDNNDNLVEVAVPKLSPSATAGKDLFDSNCAQCHGQNASGRAQTGPPLVHKIYHPGHHGDQSFILAAKIGVRAHHWPFGNMAPIEGIAQADMEKIILYVRELQRHNGIQ